MHSFRNAVRSSLSIISLSLLATTAVVGVTAITAPAAFSQTKTKNEAFAKAYTEAKTALTAGKYADALPKIDAAAAAAKDTSEKIAAADMRVMATGQLRKYPELIKAIEARQALGAVPASVARNHKEMLAGAYDATRQTDKAVQITKELINETGGTSTQFAYVANNSLAGKKYDEAVSYATKAIDAAKKEGKKPNAKHYNIVLAAQQNSGKMDKYYETLERVAPILNQDIYWRPLIEKAKKEPKYKPNDALLDVYRAMEASGVKLNETEQKEMGEFSLNAGLPVESERVLTPLVKSGAYGGAKDAQADRNKKFYERAQADAKAAKAGGLEKAAADAATKPTGLQYVVAGQGYESIGDHAKAVELIQKGLDKGQMEPGITELAKLRLGISQFKGGKKDEARKTWAGVTGDNGAGWLARVWTGISRSGA